MSKKIGFLGGKFLPLHLGHIYLIATASTYVDVLYIVLSYSNKRDKELCQREGIKYIPSAVRSSWIGEAVRDLDNVKIIHVEDDHWDHDYDWEDGANKIKEAIGEPIDYVFSSENDYDKHFSKYYPDAKHIVIDYKRETVPISATQLRKKIYDNWDKIPLCVRPYFVKKVAVVGTESCGKTTLVKKLAKLFNTVYVQEVGREYSDKYSNQLTEDMFNLIAMEHYLLQQKKARESNKVLFIDSEAVITQYYLDMYFKGKKSDLIEEIIKIQDYDLVLFLEPDVKWVDDGLRFAGKDDERYNNNKRLKEMFDSRGIKYVTINGDYTSRFNKAKDLVKKLMEAGK